MIGALGLVFVVLIVIWLGVNFIEDPDDFVNIFLIGLTRGCVYALVALGYTLVYGILQLINFAHGDVFALSGLVSSTVLLSCFNVTHETTRRFVVRIDSPGRWMYHCHILEHAERGMMGELEVAP